MTEAPRFRQAARPNLDTDQVKLRWTEGSYSRTLSVAAPSLEQAFAGAALALCGLLESTEDVEPDRLPILIQAADVQALFRAFLRDVMTLVDVEKFATLRIERLDIDGLRLRAAVSGETMLGELPPADVDLRRAWVESRRKGWVARLEIGR
jgi:SHS2 domain-containing protein